MPLKSCAQIVSEVGSLTQLSVEREKVKFMQNLPFLFIEACTQPNCTVIGHTIWHGRRGPQRVGWRAWTVLLDIGRVSRTFAGWGYGLGRASWPGRNGTFAVVVQPACATVSCSWWSKMQTMGGFVAPAAAGALALPAQQGLGSLLWVKPGDGGWWGCSSDRWGPVSSFVSSGLNVLGKMEKQNEFFLLTLGYLQLADERGRERSLV